MDELVELYNNLEVYLENNDREKSIKTMKTLMEKSFKIDEKEIEDNGMTFMGYHTELLRSLADNDEIYNAVCKEIYGENKIDIVSLDSITKENIDRFYAFPYSIKQLKNEEREKYLTPSQKKKLDEAKTDEEREKIHGNMEFDIVNLIVATGKDKVKEYLNKPTVLKNFGLFSRNFVDLIKSTGEVKRYLDEPEKIKILKEDFGLNPSGFAELIESTGEVKGYLDESEKLKILKEDFGLEPRDFVYLIKSTGDVKDYLNNPEKIKDFELSSSDITELVKSTGDDVDNYLTPSQKKALDEATTYKDKENIRRFDMVNLFVATGKEKVEEYLKEPEKLRTDFKLQEYDFVELIKSTGKEKVEEYLKEPEKLEDFRLTKEYIIELIKSTGKEKVEEYLNDPEKLRTDFDLKGYDFAELIKSTGKEKVEEYLNDPEKLRTDFNLNGYDFAKLIKSTGNVEDYLNNPEKFKDFKLDSGDITELIKSTGKVDDYLTPSQKKVLAEAKTDEEREEIYGNMRFDMINLIVATGKVEEYLNDPEKLRTDFNLKGYDFAKLIISTGKVDNYLKEPEKLRTDFNLKGYDFVELIKSTGNVEDYLKNPEKFKDFKLDSGDITKLIKSTGNVDNYLTLSQKKVLDEAKTDEEREEIYGNMRFDMINLIVATGKVEDYLNDPEKIKGFNFDNSDIAKLIISTENIEENLNNVEMLNSFGLDSITLWNLLEPSDQRQCLDTFINISEVKENPENLIHIWCETKDPKCRTMLMPNVEKLGIDFEKYNEIYLAYRDSEALKKRLDAEIFNESNSREEINDNIDSIYTIFMTNDLPMFLKTFEFFKYHNNYNSSNPYLYNGKTQEERDKIICGDLFKVSLESNNTQLINFLELLNVGDKIMGKSVSETNDELDEAILLQYRDTIFSMYNTFYDKKLETSEDYRGDLEKLKESKNCDNLGNEVLNDFLSEVGFDKTSIGITGEATTEKLLEYINQCNKESIERNSNSKEVKLEEGDIIKGFDIQFLGDQLKNGIRAKEFYGKGEMQSDFTPLDTDFSQITKDHLGDKKNIDQIIGSTVSSKYGNTFYVIKKGDFNIDDSIGGEGTRYLRTGIGSSHISSIITSEWSPTYGYAMAEAGTYIPVIDRKTEECIFSYEKYKEIREQMKGMSHYRADNFVIDTNAFNEKILEKATELKSSDVGNITTEEKRNKIVETVGKAVSDGTEIATDMVGDLSSRSIEFIDTGSTGRGTNIPGDGDFDFILKAATREQQLREMDNIANAITDVKENVRLGDGSIRYKGVAIDGLESTIDLDITPERKDLMEYSSDLCVRDRLNNIEKIHGEDKKNIVIDNIIVAKKFLKDNGVYKKVSSNGSTEYGGFGGIGVENWILQNGGSFVLAMETFLDKTFDEKGEEVSFAKFKENYPIYDFGENHRQVGERHDCFINGLAEEGFTQMKKIFKDQLKELGIEFTPGKHCVEIDEKDSFFRNLVKDCEKNPDMALRDYEQATKFISKLKTHKREKEASRDNVAMDVEK